MKTLTGYPLRLLTLSLLFLGACSSVNNSDNQEEIRYFDMTGIYRVSDTADGIVPSITSMQINTGQNSDEASVLIFRNGLNFDERNYFADLGLLEWADSEFGRELNLRELKDGFSEKNSVNEEGLGELNVCTRKKAFNDLSMDFMYCIEILKEEDQTDLEGELVLYAFENNQPVHQVKIEYSLFEKDRLSVDYFGNWTGEITKEGAYFYDLTLATGSDFRITFQPVNQTEYIVRPLDVNQNVRLYNETFVLNPVNRPQAELENNANPFINFIYVSEQNGSRIIKFNSTVTRRGRIEGNVVLETFSGDTEILATYWLEKD
jgi:hypothetical protein